MCLWCQGDWVWLDVKHPDNSEYDVAVGAVVVRVDNSRVYLLDDDKQVCDIGIFPLDDDKQQWVFCPRYGVLT